MRRALALVACSTAMAVLAVLASCSSSVDGAPQPGTTVAGPASAARSGTVVSSSRVIGSGSATAPAGSAVGSGTASVGTDATNAPDGADVTTAPDSTLPFGEPPPSQLPADPATTGPSAGAVPAGGLDAASAQWFTTYCRGTSEIAQYNTLDTSGLALPALTEARVAAYSGISQAASTTVGVLQATPPPTFAGGAALAASVVTRFSVFADVYGRGALSLQASPPPTEAALQAAVGTIEQEAAASIPNSMSEVDSGVLTAAKQLPECQAVLN